MAWQPIVGASPRPAGIPEDPSSRPQRRRVAERARGHDDLPPAARVMRQRRAAAATERRREALRRWQVEANHRTSSRRPRELARRDVEVRRVRAAGGLATTRTVAVGKAQERSVDLVGHFAAQTTTAQDLTRHVELASGHLATDGPRADTAVSNG